MSNHSVVQHLAATLIHNMTNASHEGMPDAHAHGNHTITEGGFLSGRNPFVFVASAPLPTFIVQLVVIVSMSRFVKLFLSPIKQPGTYANHIFISLNTEFLHSERNYLVTKYVCTTFFQP